MNLETLSILALLAAPPVLLWVFFWRRRLAEPEPLSEIAELFFFGVLAAVPLLLLRQFLADFPEYNFFSLISSTLVLVIVFALLEEVLKGLLLIFGVELNQRRFDKWEDGFEFAVLVGLGFAFAENILYFWQQYAAGGVDPHFWYMYLFRSLGTMLGHILFTGTFGYYYAMAYLFPGLAPQHERPLHYFWRRVWYVITHPLHITLRHILPGRPSVQGHATGEVIAEGLLVAVLLHTVFNSLLLFAPQGVELSFFTVPLLGAGIYWYTRRFAKALPAEQRAAQQQKGIKRAKKSPKTQTKPHKNQIKPHKTTQRRKNPKA
jgi:RsiW-degrading membrane proteinase PrsW (M82 family)